MPSKTYKPMRESKLKQMFIAEKGLFTDTPISESDYMALSSMWQDLRTRRLALDHYQCTNCGKIYSLNIHHIRYPAAWGVEKVEDLVTLCDDCHKKLHDEARKRRQ